ncbi:putative reverse transcriptase domain-containing protein [Tanacetum coccineum]
MPPRRFKKKSVRKIVERRVAKAIEKYEKTRADSNNTGGSGSTNTGGTVVPEMHGCSYKTFMNCKPHSFKGTEGVVGLKRWFEKIEQVFEICKCAEDDKTLGLANANQIPWSNVKAMMTTEYCPATEIEKMEQELWTLTLKGDDIEARAYVVVENPQQNPNVVTGTFLLNDHYACILPEGIKGNIFSSKPATLHEANQTWPALVDQSDSGPSWRKDLCWKFTKVQSMQLTSSWTDPSKGLESQKMGHLEKDCRFGVQGAGNNFLQNVTCFGCGEKGHYKDKCPKARKPSE